MKSWFFTAIRAAYPYSFAFFVFLSVMGWSVLSEGYPDPWKAALIAVAAAAPVFLFRLWRGYRRFISCKNSRCDKRFSDMAR